MTYYNSQDCKFGSINYQPYLQYTDLMTSATKVGSMNSTASFVVVPQHKCSSSSSTATRTTPFPLYAKYFESASALWKQINFIHISRQELPAVSYISLYNCLICPSLACHWAYHKHFVQSGCVRSVNSGN